MDEREAIRRLQAGDASGLAVLVQRYQTQAVRAAYLITRDQAMAEDVVQAVYLRTYQRIAQFDPARPFGPWFLRSVVNAAVRATQQRARLVPLPEEGGEGPHPGGGGLADPRPGPMATLEAAETRAELWAALGRLTPAQREAIVLRYYLNLHESAMAVRLGCPPGTIKSRLYTARTRLRLLLRPLMNHSPNES